MLQRLLLAQPRRGDQGLTLLVALVAAVVIVTAAASLASRTLSTQMGSSRLGDSREAREAAEAGLATVISELNRQRNRQMLTAAVGMKAWSNPTNEAALTNVCSDDKESTPDPATLAIGQGTPQPVPGSNGMSQYTLLAMEVSTADRTVSFRSGSDGTVTTSGNYNPRRINPDESGAFGYLRVEVKGEAKNPQGGLISSSTVVRDFKLIPKSCRRSPATPYGNEVRASLMRPLIVGFNGGGFTTVSNGSHTGLTQAVCLILPGATTCGGSNPAAVNGIPVLPMALGANFDTWLPEPQRYPCPGGGLCTGASVVIDTANQNYIQVRSDGTIVRLCRYNAGSPLSCPGTNLIKDYCVRAPLPAPATQSAFHCRIDRIITKPGEPLYVDTSNGPIYLYINTAWTKPSVPIDLDPNAGILGTYCDPPPTGLNPCTTDAPSPSADKPPRAMIFTDLAGSLDLSPRNAITGFFLWAPKLTVNITNPGSADAFSGALWVNNLSLGPGSKSTYWEDLPAGSATTGTPFPPSGTTPTPTPFRFRNLSYDVVARPCSSDASASGAGCARGVSR